MLIVIPALSLLLVSHYPDLLLIFHIEIYLENLYNLTVISK